MAATAGKEAAGNPNYQQDHMSAIFEKGFSFSGFERNCFYLNLGTKRRDDPAGRPYFTDISGVSGIDAIEDGRGIIYADFDNDGDYDIFLTNIQGETHLLFKNEVGQGNRFLRVALEGAKSGKDAYGAVVRVKTEAGILTKIKSGGSGFLSQHDQRLLFGLGQSGEVEWLEVTWPSGLKQRFKGIAANASLKIVEGESSHQLVNEKRFQLPAPLSKEAAYLSDLKVKKGEVFPDLKLSSLNQAEASLNLNQILVPGRRYLVNLWATYCVPCLKEMPELQKIHDRYKGNKDDNVQVIGISLDINEADTVKRFLKEHNIGYPIYMADESLADKVYATDKVFIPISFILDGDRRVVEIFAGAILPEKMEVWKWR